MKEKDIFVRCFFTYLSELKMNLLNSPITFNWEYEIGDLLKNRLNIFKCFILIDICL